jgi:hypothetical protein
LKIGFGLVPPFDLFRMAWRWHDKSPTDANSTGFVWPVLLFLFFFFFFFVARILVFLVLYLIHMHKASKQELGWWIIFFHEKGNYIVTRPDFSFFRFSPRLLKIANAATCHHAEVSQSWLQLYFGVNTGPFFSHYNNEYFKKYITSHDI